MFFSGQSQLFEIEILESVKKKEELSRLAEIMSSPILAFIDIENIKDPCYLCFDLGLIYSNEVPLLYKPPLEDDFGFKLKCQEKESSVNRIFDLYERKREIPLQFRDNIHEFFSCLDKFFQDLEMLNKSMDKAHRTQQAIKKVKDQLKRAEDEFDRGERSRLENEEFGFIGELNEMKKQLNRQISAGLNSLIDVIQESYHEIESHGRECTNQDDEGEANLKFYT